MKYHYNLYSKIQHKQKKEFIYNLESGLFKRSFKNRINKINKVSKKRPVTTIKKLNY